MMSAGFRKDRLPSSFKMQDAALFSKGRFRYSLPFSAELCLYIIAIMMPLMIVVDSVNGAFLRAGFPSISQPFKVFFLVVLAVFCLNYRKGCLWVSICLVSNALFVISHVLLVEGLSGVVSDLQWLLRFNITWLGFFVFFKAYKIGALSLRWFRIVFWVASCVLALNLILGTVGYGYSQYGGADDSAQIGAVGFIYAGNEMSFLMLVCQIVVCGDIYSDKKRVLYYVAVSAVFFMMAVMKATKVAMVGSLLVMLWYPCMEIIRSLYTMRLGSRRVIVFISLSVVLASMLIPIASEMIDRVGIIGRMSFFLEDRGIMFMIFSGREIWVYEFIHNVWPRMGFVENIFGMGRAQLDAAIGKPIEIDLFDLFGGFGLFGVAIYYGFYFIRVVPAIRRFKFGGVFSDMTLSLVLFSFFISNTAGHVIYSGLATPYVSLALGFCAAGLMSAGSSNSTIEGSEG